MLIVYTVNWKLSLYLISDIDECMTENGGCNQTCTNQIGSFVCSCNVGFELDIDGLACNGKLSLVMYIYSSLE